MATRPKAVKWEIQIGARFNYGKAERERDERTPVTPSAVIEVELKLYEIP